MRKKRPNDGKIHEEDRLTDWFSSGSLLCVCVFVCVCDFLYRYYCGLQMNVCGDSQERESQYDDEASCVARCEAYVGAGAWPLGNIGTDHDSNTLACR